MQIAITDSSVLEVAMLDVREGTNQEFEQAFELAAPIIASMSGYIRHELQCCIENSNKYVLLVWWETLEDHTLGFRKSLEYQRWKDLLHKFYVPFPTVLHYQKIL
ncbi:MAG: antibiotic biosynthesis monooxygenase [Burkholderiales bacterium]|jgi:heme-degrading monooxygenase HmoA|nr:antibiotic biosynthesis protein [uncultured bacterium]MBP7847244.1 antibiotic biosynthesis monooxygenase [Burkholderiales bacterium]MBP9769223.1 antibiotic biosynthesis monooxygenase [Burkholderiales bacterium]